MNTRKIYRKVKRLLIAAFLPVFAVSCETIKDDMDDCGIYLEFIYDYNMEYVDSFGVWVDAVDVFIFDADGRFMFSKHAERDELIGGNRMFLGGDLAFGQYKVLTVGGLSGSFLISGSEGEPFVPGQTMMEDVRIALMRESAVVSTGFPSFWVSPAMEINYNADLSVWPVNLIKDTNRFYLSLAWIDGDDDAYEEGTIPFTFEIITPEGAVYGHDNNPVTSERVSYQPYVLESGKEPSELAWGRINTMRLFREGYGGYRLLIKKNGTDRIIWEYDLMELLYYHKPDYRPDGTELPMQEFLDRKSEWSLTLLYKGDLPPDEGYVGIGIEVNDWIIWLNEIGV